MSAPLTSVDPERRAAIGKSLRRGGITLLVLGLLAVALPRVSTLAVDLVVGVMLVLAGVIGLSVMRGSSGLFAPRNAGILFGLTLVAGLLLLVFPFEGARVLTLLLTGLFVIEGAVMLAVGLRVRATVPGGMWLFVNGALTLVLAIMIGAGWPASGLSAIGLLFGINLLVTGLSLLLTGIALRRN